MSDYNQIAWLPLCAGLTVLGLAGSWVAWRRRGVAAGLRGAAWSLIPLAAYLIGAVALVWEIGLAVVRFATRFVLSPAVWAGIVVSGLVVVLFATAAVMRRRAIGAKTAPPPVSAPAQPAMPAKTDDDLAEIEDLLRRRGIR